MTGAASVLRARAVASRTEKCWMPRVFLVTIGPFGPFGRVSAHGAHVVPTAAAPATLAAAPRNFRRSMRTSLLILSSLPPGRQRPDARLRGARTWRGVLPHYVAKNVGPVSGLTKRPLFEASALYLKT